SAWLIRASPESRRSPTATVGGVRIIIAKKVSSTPGVPPMGFGEMSVLGGNTTRKRAAVTGAKLTVEGTSLAGTSDTRRQVRPSSLASRRGANRDPKNITAPPGMNRVAERIVWGDGYCTMMAASSDGSWTVVLGSPSVSAAASRLL